MANQSIATSVASFSFDNFPVRAINKDGNIWFVAADVCAVLGLTNITMALKSLDDDEAALNNTEVSSENGVIQKREVNIINESGLYALILRSRKPEAKRFRKWVTSEVLPSIRKTGRYIHTPYKQGRRDTLSVEQAESLRSMIRSAAEQLPAEKRASFTIAAWSKLRSHFGCKYREIPAGEYQEAVSIISRHFVEYRPALPASKVIPAKQAEELLNLAHELAGLFHPMSHFAAAAYGLLRLLKGLDARMSTAVAGYVDLTGGRK